MDTSIRIPKDTQKRLRLLKIDELTPIDQLDKPKDSEIDGSDTEVVDQVRYKRSIIAKIKGLFSRLRPSRSKYQEEAPTGYATPLTDNQQEEEEEWVSPTMEASRAGRTTMFTPISTLREEGNADGKPTSLNKEIPDVGQETITTDLSPDTPSEEVEFHVEFDRIYPQYCDVVQIEEYVVHWKTHKPRLDHHKKLVELQDQYDTAVVATVLHQLGKEITTKQIMKAVKPYLDLSSHDLENILHGLEKEKQHISRLRTKNLDDDIITITWAGKKYKRMIDRRMRQTQHLLDPIKDDDVLLIHLSAINEKLRSRSIVHQMIALIRWIQVLNYMHFKRKKLLDPRLASLEASLDIEKPVDNVEDFLKELQVKYIPIVHQISTQIMATPQQLPLTRTMTSKEMHRMPTLGSQSPVQAKSEQIGLDPIIVPKLDKIKGTYLKPKSKPRTRKPIKEETSPQVGVQEEFEVSTVKTGKLQKAIKFKKNTPITSKEKVDADGLRHHEQLVEYTKDDVDKATKFWTTQKRVKSSKKFFVIQPGVGVNPDTPDISTPIYKVIPDFPISSLAVDRRFRKILERAKLQTLGEVANTTVDFTSVKGVGKKTASAIIHLQAILQRAEAPEDILPILTDEGIVELSTRLKHEVKLTDTDMSRSTLFPLETEEVDQFKVLIDASKTPLEVGNKVIAYLFELLHVEGEVISFDAKCTLLNQYQSKNHPLLL
ncbi:MAG: hypothetical protein IH840_03480 [Candidatus Heimdallarchaeota archaeon]|nr:hypothetical protein [Candidatus Heimdallarchaeota archaeon]